MDHYFKVMHSSTVNSGSITYSYIGRKKKPMANAKTNLISILVRNIGNNTYKNVCSNQQKIADLYRN